MHDLDIESAFRTTGYSIYDFFQQTATGFYIPLYQREYSWDSANVTQLLDDIEKGVISVIETDAAIRFLGTIITVIERDKKRIQPQDPRSLPTAIEKIIDGQQRLTTIALIGTLLYKYIFDTKESLLKLNTDTQDDIIEVCDFWLNKLSALFAFDLSSGNRQYKPKIIRGHVDKWIKDGDITEAYQSDAAAFFAAFIQAISTEKISLFDIKKDNKSRFYKNADQINKWLKEISNPNASFDDDYPKAWELLQTSTIQEYIWRHDRANLLEIVNKKDVSNKKSESYLLCSLVQLFGVCHYLLDRCCFTVIQPKNEEWAFDMFQSLNASGTPLTAIETFRPLVVNMIERSGKKFEDSITKQHFEFIEKLFQNMDSAAKKSSLTNDFLTSVAIAINAYKLESHFSAQRKYLDTSYNELKDKPEMQSLFIQFMGYYADFYKSVWLDYKGDNNQAIDQLRLHPEGELASLLILFLKKSNHRMAITILGYYYNDILAGKVNAISDFIAATKAISAFYIIWRAAVPNAGLDNVYRTFFKGNDKLNPPHLPQSWLHNNGASIDISVLRQYLMDTLIAKGLAIKEDWLIKASSYLKYTNSYYVCYIALFISAHDTIPDAQTPGLMKTGKAGTAPYLKLEKWHATDLKEIEHIAPKDNDGNWTNELYDSYTKLYDSIGNLTLLPAAINTSASNKSWKEKLIYYKHLAEKDPSKVGELTLEASNNGIELQASTIEILQKSNYNSHILPLTQANIEIWDKFLVTARTERILTIMWEQINSWLQNA